MIWKLFCLLLLKESFCLASPSFHWESKESSCINSDEFECSKGLCIKSSFVCNGEFDCPNHEDEDDCEFKLCKLPKWYMCRDNLTCIVYNYKCDGHYDCPDNDDEESCLDYVPHHEEVECSSNEFACISDRLCIPIEHVCDGTVHCMDKSDETLGCIDIEKKCKGFKCKNKHCLTNTAWLCDGYNDCGDNSDETGCDCTLEAGKFLCKDNHTCIASSAVCNHVNDCSDGSDEGGVCSQYKNNMDCKPNTCPDGVKCNIWPSGPVCVCPIGYKYNSVNRNCEDINECLQYGICSQGCVNTKGSYNCTCASKFKLKNDKRNCEVISSTEAFLLYAGKRSINAILLTTRHHYIVSDNLHQTVGVSYDGHYIYWTDIAVKTESIMKAREDGSKMEVLLTAGLSAPEDISVDWLTGNIYFTDGLYMHIAVCSNSGIYCTALVNKDIHKPRGLALYPQKGQMYWSDWGDKPMIAVSYMDGSEAKSFVTQDIHWPNGVTLDWPNDRLYWVDAKLQTIQSIQLDGTSRRTVLAGVLKHPYGIAIYENNIFWSDWDTKSIQSCDKFYCKNRETVVRDRKIFDIHIYHSAIQQTGNNACLGSKCSHLCLLSGSNSHTCVCPQGMHLNIDQVSCSDSVKRQTMLLGIRNYLISLEHKTFGKNEPGAGEALSMYIHKMAYNVLTGEIFIADNVQQTIYNVDIKTKETTVLVKTNIGNISALAFDYLGNNLYWTDSDRGTIEVLSLITNFRAIVHHFVGSEKPIALALIPENGQMFIALRSQLGHTHIDMQNMHGRGFHHHIIESNLGNGQIQFTVDKELKEIFWTDSEENKISFTDFEGYIHHTFMANLEEPISLAVLGDDIFWTTAKSLKVYWTPKHNLGTTKKLMVTPTPYLTVEDEIVLLATSPTIVIDHICKSNRMDCSHICVPLGMDTFACMCPPGMVFTSAKNTTCIEASDCEFRCNSGECILMSLKCNGHADCSDKSDEQLCDSKSDKKLSKKCESEEFKCADGSQCISYDLRCDLNFDCIDKSDEADCEHYNQTNKCHKNQYACPSGLCIDISAVCDGYKDCADGSDEFKCSPEKTASTCKPDFFKCTSGQCIPLAWVCDQASDCTDGSDEHNCPEKPCPEKFSKCAHGQCIDTRLICDGNNDCGDNSDEINCSKDRDIVCGEEDSDDHEPTKFQCISDKTICLDIKARCNGTAECPRGEDEADCSGCRINEFECENKKCIRAEWRCDKEKDCDDGSDENNCKTNTSSTWSISSENCQDHMFDCKDGSCIEMSNVCDGSADCTNKLDESGQCKTSCLSNPCDQICSKSPYGPICSCKAGFKLAGDKKRCLDIDECTEFNPCAQKCDNTKGSFICSCYIGFMLRSDKITCKSLGVSKYMLYSSSNIIWKIIPSLSMLWSSNSSKIIGMDVHIKKNLLYFTVEDSGALYEFNFISHKLNYVDDIGNPTVLAVDWATNNVYFVDENSPPSIKICHVAEKACVRLILFKYKDVVRSLAVDSVNNLMFYTVLHFWIFSTPDTVIYRHNLDGTRAEIIVKEASHISAITCDPNKKRLYYTEMSTNSIWSINYDGTDKQVEIKKHQMIKQPAALNIFEDQLIVTNIGSQFIAQCKLYGDRECKLFKLNVFNAENVIVVQQSRQKDVENICDGSNCSLICVQADRGPKCLCHGGAYVKPGVSCKEANEIKMSPKFKSDLETKEVSESGVGKAIGIIFIFFATTLAAMGGYFIYKKKLVHKKFNISMYFQNPNLHNIDNAQVKMCLPKQSSTQRYNEIFLNTGDNTDLCVPSTPTVDEENMYSIGNSPELSDSLKTRLIS